MTSTAITIVICDVSTLTKGGGSIFLVVRQVRHEIFKFNYIHDYDIIIIGHERSSKVTGMLCCRRVQRQREKMAVISKKQIKPKETPLIL